jgi:hypothetical protein
MTDTAALLRTAAERLGLLHSTATDIGFAVIVIPVDVADALARLLESAARDEVETPAYLAAVALARAILGDSVTPEAAETGPDGGVERPDTRSTGASTSEAQSGAQGRVKPFGGTGEVLPRRVLAQLHLRPYLSTACDTAIACGRAELRDQAADLHKRCRRTHKFTGASCVCACHREDQP